MLKKFAVAGIFTAAAAGVVLLAGPASADNTGGTGNAPVPVPINVPVNVPVTVCGNSVPVNVSSGAGPATLGDTSSGCEGDALVAGNDQGISGH